MHGLPLTADDAEGFETLIDPVNAEVTLLCLLLSLSVKYGIEGASLYA